MRGSSGFTATSITPTVTAMSEHPPCSCRLPWLTAAACAFVAGAVLAFPRTTADLPATPSAPAPVDHDARLSEARHEADELRRVLDTAQSALAQRDREIAAAEDELRNLRQELATLRAKPAPSP